MVINLSRHPQAGRIPKCISLGLDINKAFCVSSGISKDALGFIRLELNMERTLQPEEDKA